MDNRTFWFHVVCWSAGIDLLDVLKDTITLLVQLLMCIMRFMSWTLHIFMKIIITTLFCNVTICFFFFFFLFFFQCLPYYFYVIYFSLDRFAELYRLFDTQLRSSATPIPLERNFMVDFVVHRVHDIFDMFHCGNFTSTI